MRYLFLFITILANFELAFAQCFPRETQFCEDAVVICGLEDLNGMGCAWSAAWNGAGPQPQVCALGAPPPPAAAPENMGWWAFTTQGGAATISITTSNCSGTGLEAGVWETCGFLNQVACDAQCNGNTTIVLAMNLEPCKTYYFFIDGCNGSTCDISVSTSGGKAPTLSTPIGDINDNSSKKDKVCLGYCDYELEVNDQPMGCAPYYEWTIDGVAFGGSKHKETWPEFDTEGTFVICVRAIIGNPQSGNQNNCDEDGPSCITITVEDEAVGVAGPRILCNEESGFYTWGNNVIFHPGGNYTGTFRNSDCCVFDSIVTFQVLDAPEEVDIYHIGCNKSDVYIDTLGRKQPGCATTQRVVFRDILLPYKCDSTIKLHQFILDAQVKYKIECMAGEIKLFSGIDWSNSCYDKSIIPDIDVSYKWYYDGVGNGIIIGTEEDLIIKKEGKHCLEATFTISYGDKKRICKRDMGCESFKEDELAPRLPKLEGAPDTICVGQNGIYFLDTMIAQKILNFDWQVDFGSIITKDPFLQDTIEINWNKLGTGRVCLKYETDCGISPQKCIDVLIVTGPTPFAGEDVSYCETLQGKMNARAGVSGQWSVLNGPGNVVWTNDKNNTSDITVSDFGNYTFIWSESANGCSASDTVLFQFNAALASTPIQYICNGNQNYTFNLAVLGGIAPFAIIRGSGFINANNVFTSNPIQNNTGDTLILRDANGCLISIPYFKECLCANIIGILDAQAENACEGLNIIVVYDAANELRNPGDTLVYVLCTDPNNPFQAGSFVKLLPSPTIIFSAPIIFDTQYFVVAVLGQSNGMGSVDINSLCTFYSSPKPISFIKNPSPNAGADDNICGTQYSLLGSGSIAGSTLRWQQLNGTNVTILNSNIANTNISLQGNNFGTHRFRLTENNKNCIKEDFVDITFNQEPVIDKIELKCINLADPKFPYVVSAKINGGKAPFIIIQGNGSIGGTNGDEYTSAEYASLDSFKILIQDANGCISQLVFGIHQCDCGLINVGTMPTSSVLQACQDQCINFTPNKDEVIQSEDIAMYVLHEQNGASLSAIIWDTIKATDPYQVCFKFGMVLGQTYYISKVVGDDTLIRDGIVDIKDPCKRVSNGIPVIWNAYPVPFAGRDTAICGRSFSFEAFPSLGTGEWLVINKPNGSNVTILNPNNSNSNLTVNLAGTYVFEWTENNQSCMRSDSVVIQFLNAPRFSSALRYECDSIAENYRVVVDITDGDAPTWNVVAKNGPNTISGRLIDTNTWRSDWIPQNTILNLELSDINHCDTAMESAIHVCPCLSKLGSLNVNPIILCESDNAQVLYSAAGAILDPNDALLFILHDGSNVKTANILSSNLTGGFSFDNLTMQYAKTYYISVVIGNRNGNTVNLNDRCAVSQTVPVTWYENPIANIIIPDTLTCKITEVELDGTRSISKAGGLLSFNWTKINGVGGFTSSTTQGKTNVNGPGQYQLEITDLNSNCKSIVTTTVLRIDQFPPVEAGPMKELNCKTLQVELDGTGSLNANATYQWSGPGIVSGLNDIKAVVNKPGVYTIRVTNKANGCSDIDTVLVTEDIRKPTARISQQGVLLCSIPAIQLDALQSSGGAGAICNYNWTTLNGNINGSVSNVNIEITKSGRYIVQVIDCNNGCTDFDTIDVVQADNPLSSWELNAIDPLCNNQQDGKINIIGVKDKNNIFLNNLSYALDGGGFSNQINFANLTPGAHTLRVRDANGCEKDTVIQINNPTPVFVELQNDLIVNQAAIIDLETLIKNSSPRDVFKDEWVSIKAGILSNPNQITILQDDIYIITTYNEHGCPAKDTIRITIRVKNDIWWPNVISPDIQGDPKNNKFGIFGNNLKSIKDLRIYDRWGEKVFDNVNLTPSSPEKDGWDGTFRDAFVSPGVYPFIANVELQDGTTKLIFGEVSVVK